MLRHTVFALALAGLCAATAQPAAARDWYVSAARGKGKKGTKEKPAKDLGNIVKKLQAGDVVHIAEGVYLGRGKSGSVTLNVPVQIIGGYSDDFSTRDPWGAHRTIFSGDNLTKNYTPNPALYVDLSKYEEKNAPILVDGIIFDASGRNRYSGGPQGPRQQVILLANPKTGENPSPTLGTLVIKVGRSERFDRGPRWKITVQNCIVMNSVTTQGCLAVSGYKGSEVTIRNNLIINNSGIALWAGTKFMGDGPPKFLIENNTVLFTWRHTINNETGSSFGCDKNIDATLRNNVFAVADRYGINNGKGATLLLINNNITGNLAADYREGSTLIAWEDIEDEAECLHEDSEDNVSEPIQVPVSAEWAKLYASRVVVDREKLEADVKAKGTPINDLRRLLGLSVEGTSIKGPESPVFVHAMSVDDACKAGAQQYGGRGCQKP
ncbi:MAG: right-handed parallel beta-helix repeat-containing protein [Planctomycetota bacterium]|nr:MAG: right-handed parallel beta-helix repeat-containing protein [Planctomycetota bacterium]